MKRFTILGLGWLGHPLSKSLEDKYCIKASVRSEDRKQDFKNEKYDIYVLNENNYENLEYLLDTDFLFINYPPSKFEDYIDFLEKIYNHPKIKSIQKIFFASSTSIYPNLNEEFDETYEIKIPKTKRVFDAENFIKDKTNYILRIAGLMGANRIAGKYYSDKTVKDANAVVNFIHRDDVINAIEYMIDNNINDGIYNLVSPAYPTKEEIYSLNCKKLNIKLPIFEENTDIINRKISSKKLLDSGFTYKYLNPIDYPIN